MSVRDRPWVHVTWCDDIRQEVGNKPSFMGVYTAALIIPSLPATLPRLAAQIQVCYPAVRRPKNVVVKISRSDGLVLAEASVPAEVLDMVESAEETASREAAGLPPMGTFSLGVILAAVELPVGVTSLRATVDIDGEVVPSYRLRVLDIPSLAQTRTSPT
jgi:hypothetical protein